MSNTMNKLEYCTFQADRAEFSLNIMHLSNLSEYKKPCVAMIFGLFILLTSFTSTEDRPHLQYLSVHSRFHPRYYHHFLFCQICGDYLSWTEEGVPIGAFDKTSSSDVLDNSMKIGNDDNVNASIRLASLEFSNHVCVSSLFIATLYRKNLNSGVFCNSLNVSNNNVNFPDLISNASAANGSVEINYIFAAVSNITSYSLAYHGLLCRTTKPSQIWLINNVSISLSSLNHRRFSVKMSNKIKFIVVVLDRTAAQTISFLSISYFPPLDYSITVKCTAEEVLEKASVSLVNILSKKESTNSFTSTKIEETSSMTGKSLPCKCWCIILTSNDVIRSL